MVKFQALFSYLYEFPQLCRLLSLVSLDTAANNLEYQLSFSRNQRLNPSTITITTTLFCYSTYILFLSHRAGLSSYRIQSQTKHLCQILIRLRFIYTMAKFALRQRVFQIRKLFFQTTKSSRIQSKCKHSFSRK